MGAFDKGEGDGAVVCVSRGGDYGEGLNGKRADDDRCSRLGGWPRVDVWARAWRRGCGARVGSKSTSMSSAAVSGDAETACVELAGAKRRSRRCL